MNHDITGDACAGDGIGFAVRIKGRGVALAANRHRNGIIIVRSLVQGEGIIRGIGCRGRRRCVCCAGAGNSDGISLRSSVGVNDQVSGDIAHRKAAIIVLADGNRLAAHGATGKAVIIMRILLRSKGIIFAMAHSSCAGKPFGQGDGIVAGHGDGGGRARAHAGDGAIRGIHRVLILSREGCLLLGNVLLRSEGNRDKVASLQRLTFALDIHGRDADIGTLCISFRFRNGNFSPVAKADIVFCINREQVRVIAQLVRYGDGLLDILVKRHSNGNCFSRLDAGLVHAGGQIRRKCAYAQAEHQDHSQKHR